MALALLRHPHASLLKSMECPAQREGGYRFLRNKRLPTDGLEKSRGLACIDEIDACGGDVLIVVDQTSFHLPDHTGTRDFGSVGNRSTDARGVHLMSAIALDAEGTPLEMLYQDYWTRSETPGPALIRPGKKERDLRPPEERESFYWMRSVKAVCELLDLRESRGTPWLQCDRGADFWGTFAAAVEHDVWVTVRVYTNRQIVLDDGQYGKLMPWMEGLPKVGSYTVELMPTETHAAREAEVSVRFGRATVPFGPKLTGRQLIPLYYVYALEENPPPGESPLCWRLATTFPVRTLGDALRVIANYRMRWRVETFHQTIKSGVCNLERSQLESFDAFRRWAIILSSVAVRVEHLKLRSRTEPDAPATEEFSRDEIDTAIILRHAHTTKNKPPYMPGDTPRLAEIVLWIADLGGYMGSRSKPKPGTVPIARGLERLLISVEALQAAGTLREFRSD